MTSRRRRRLANVLRRENLFRDICNAALLVAGDEAAFAQAAKPGQLPPGKRPGAVLHEFDRFRQCVLALKMVDDLAISQGLPGRVTQRAVRTMR